MNKTILAMEKQCILNKVYRVLIQCIGEILLLQHKERNPNLPSVFLLLLVTNLPVCRD